MSAGWLAVAGQGGDRTPVSGHSGRCWSTRHPPCARLLEALDLMGLTSAPSFAPRQITKIARNQTHRLSSNGPTKVSCRCRPTRSLERPFPGLLEYPLLHRRHDDRPYSPEELGPLRLTPHLAIPCATANVLSVSVDFLTLDASRKRNPPAGGRVGLLSLSALWSRFHHAGAGAWVPPLGNTPSYVCPVRKGCRFPSLYRSGKLTAQDPQTGWQRTEAIFANNLPAAQIRS